MSARGKDVKGGGGGPERGGGGPERGDGGGEWDMYVVRRVLVEEGLSRERQLQPGGGGVDSNFAALCLLVGLCAYAQISEISVKFMMCAHPFARSVHVANC